MKKQEMKITITALTKQITELEEQLREERKQDGHTIQLLQDRSNQFSKIRAIKAVRQFCQDRDIVHDCSTDDYETETKQIKLKLIVQIVEYIMKEAMQKQEENTEEEELPYTPYDTEEEDHYPDRYLDYQDSNTGEEKESDEEITNKPRHRRPQQRH